LGEKHFLWLSAKHDRTPAQSFNRDEPDGINPCAGLRHRKASPRILDL
jgi:hypothetical protein